MKSSSGLVTLDPEIETPTVRFSLDGLFNVAADGGNPGSASCPLPSRVCVTAASTSHLRRSSDPMTSTTNDAIMNEALLRELLEHASGRIS